VWASKANAKSFYKQIVCNLFNFKYFGVILFEIDFYCSVTTHFIFFSENDVTFLKSITIKYKTF
jgi:hypothetical protein